MKKNIALVMAMVFMAVPMSVRAEEAVSTNEVVYDEAYGWHDSFNDGSVKYEKVVEDYLVIFKPVVAQAKANPGSVKITANVTSTSCMTVVQVSKRKDFKDAVPYTFTNKSYLGTIKISRWYEYNVYFRKDGTKGHNSNKVRIAKLNNKTLAYRKQNNLSGGDYFPITPSMINDFRNRPGIKQVKTMTIPGIRNGENYFYRARSIYIKDGIRYFSPWTNIKVVR